MVQYVFSRPLVRTTCNTSSKIHLCTFFLSQIQVKLIEICYFTRTMMPKFKTPLSGFILKYCFIDLPLNFTMCSATLWVASFDTYRETLLLKWIIEGLASQPLSECPETLSLSLHFLCLLFQWTASFSITYDSQ